MRTWRSSDASAHNDAATSLVDDKDDQHLDTQDGRVQVLLRAELGQLVVQMFLGLLHGMPRMRVDDNRDNKNHFNNGNNNAYTSRNYCHDVNNVYTSRKYCHDVIGAAVQALVRGQRQTLGKEV